MLHGRLAGLMERSAKSPMQVVVNSDLHGDDIASAPFQTSHAVDGLLSVAIDHVHALTSLVIATRTLHRTAPFTLARAAIESASGALWILDPADRATRVQRTLQLHAIDARDASRASADLNAPLRVTLKARIQQLQEVASAAGYAFAGPIGPMSATELVKCADKYVSAPAGTGLLGAWRLFSGMAHGRPWAQTGFGDTRRTRLNDQLDQVITQTSVDRVVYAASISADAIEAGLVQRNRRARRSSA